jgi:Fe-S-cluster-containing hydrogenase component 2
MCAEAIQQELQHTGADTELLNVTSYASRQKAFAFDDYTGAIFGFPVFGDFAPSVINDWIPTLDGNKMPCAMFFTYGARTTGYAHFHTKLLLEQANFQVLFSAEFLGRHTFNLAGWQILPDRPDERDFAVCRQFAALALERFVQESPEKFSLQKPFAYQLKLEKLQKSAQQEHVERGWTHPVRSADTCQMCRRCETECPNQAFDADTGLSDPSRCIKCQHCVYICPDKALKVDDRMKGAYTSFLQDWHLTEEMMQAKQSKLITASWQAAC